MCERCADLEERVAWLEGELGLAVEAGAWEAIHRAFVANLTHLRGCNVGRPQAAKLVARLYAAKGKPVSRWLLLDAVPSPTRKDRADNTVAVWVTLARKALGHDSIASVWGFGYRLTPSGLSKVAEILGETGKAVAA